MKDHSIDIRHDPFLNERKYSKHFVNYVGMLQQEYLSASKTLSRRGKCIKKEQILVDDAATVGGELALKKTY